MLGPEKNGINSLKIETCECHETSQCNNKWFLKTRTRQRRNRRPESAKLGPAKERENSKVRIIAFIFIKLRDKSKRHIEQEICEY